MKQTPLQALLTREVSRKEFLATLGIGILTVAGLGRVYKFIGTHKSGSASSLRVGPSNHTGYGGR